MQSRYKKLRDRMYENQVTQDDLSAVIDRCYGYVSERMTGKKSFRMEDVYYICDYLKIPYSEIYIYFPPNGVEAKMTARDKP